MQKKPQKIVDSLPPSTSFPKCGEILGKDNRDSQNGFKGEADIIKDEDLDNNKSLQEIIQNMNLEGNDSKIISSGNLASISSSDFRDFDSFIEENLDPKNHGKNSEKQNKKIEKIEEFESNFNNKKQPELKPFDMGLVFRTAGGRKLNKNPKNLKKAKKILEGSIQKNKPISNTYQKEVNYTSDEDEKNLNNNSISESDYPLVKKSSSIFGISNKANIQIDKDPFLSKKASKLQANKNLPPKIKGENTGSLSNSSSNFPNKKGAISKSNAIINQANTKPQALCFVSAGGKKLNIDAESIKNAQSLFGDVGGAGQNNDSLMSDLSKTLGFSFAKDKFSSNSNPSFSGFGPRSKKKFIPPLLNINSMNNMGFASGKNMSKSKHNFEYQKKSKLIPISEISSSYDTGNSEFREASKNKREILKINRSISSNRFNNKANIRAQSKAPKSKKFVTPFQKRNTERKNNNRNQNKKKKKKYGGLNLDINPNAKQYRKRKMGVIQNLGHKIVKKSKICEPILSKKFKIDKNLEHKFIDIFSDNEKLKTQYRGRPPQPSNPSSEYSTQDPIIIRPPKIVRESLKNWSIKTTQQLYQRVSECLEPLGIINEDQFIDNVSLFITYHLQDKMSETAPDLTWIIHHLLMISRKIQNFRNNFYTFEQVSYLLNQILNRYRVECIYEKASHLKQIIQSKIAKSKNTPKFQLLLRVESVVRIEQRYYQIKMSDGWYKVQMKIGIHDSNKMWRDDEDQQQLWPSQLFEKQIKEDKITRGTFLSFSNYSVNILDPTSSTTGSVFGRWQFNCPFNSTSIVRNKSSLKLGFWQPVKKKRLKTLKVKGGSLGIVDVVIVHVFGAKITDQPDFITSCTEGDKENLQIQFLVKVIDLSSILLSGSDYKQDIDSSQENSYYIRIKNFPYSQYGQIQVGMKIQIDNIKPKDRLDIDKNDPIFMNKKQRIFHLELYKSQGNIQCEGGEERFKNSDGSGSMVKKYMRGLRKYLIDDMEEQDNDNDSQGSGTGSNTIDKIIKGLINGDFVDVCLPLRFLNHAKNRTQGKGDINFKNWRSKTSVMGSKNSLKQSELSAIFFLSSKVYIAVYVEESKKELDNFWERFQRLHSNKVFMFEMMRYLDCIEYSEDLTVIRVKFWIDFSSFQEMDYYKMMKNMFYPDLMIKMNKKDYFDIKDKKGLKEEALEILSNVNEYPFKSEKKQSFFFIDNIVINGKSNSKQGLYQLNNTLNNLIN